LVGSGGNSSEAMAELADDLRFGDVADEEAMTGSGDSHINEISHLPLRPAVQRVRLTPSGPSKMSICHGCSPIFAPDRGKDLLVENREAGGNPGHSYAPVQPSDSVRGGSLRASLSTLRLVSIAACLVRPRRHDCYRARLASRPFPVERRVRGRE